VEVGFKFQKILLFLFKIQMKIILAFFIFCLVLFIYLHVQFHLKTSNDLEMYELDMASKEKLEEICDIRQPVLFDFENDKIRDVVNKEYILNNYQAFEIKIRNVRENNQNAELFVPLPFHAATKLFNEDKTASYFSENNAEFLQETGIIKNMRYNDEFLRPYMVSNCNYDVMLGAANVCTPFRYEINYRNFFLLTQGSAQIKLAAPQSVKYLYPNYDYENFEFRSPVDPWNPQAQFKADFDKIKCLEFTLLPGKTVFIPAFWWYSIKFNKDACISCFKYRTYMNNLAALPYFGMHALQIQNVKRDVVPLLHISTLQKEPLINNINNINNIIESKEPVISSDTNANTDTNIDINTNINNSTSIDMLAQTE
jgi:hypothetical protein